MTISDWIAHINAAGWFFYLAQEHGQYYCCLWRAVSEPYHHRELVQPPLQPTIEEAFEAAYNAIPNAVAEPPYTTKPIDLSTLLNLNPINRRF